MPSSQEPASCEFPALPRPSGGAVPRTAGGQDTPRAGARSKQEAKPASAAAGASVLIVEDDPRSARLLAAHLQTAGYRPLVAHSADEAQKVVDRKVPDLVLCDVCLPGTDGIEFTGALRRQAATATVPIALITSSDDSRILARGLEAGADDFLAKPVNSLELRTRVRSLLRSKMLADELRWVGDHDRSPEAIGRCAAECQPAAPREGGLPLVAVIEDNGRDRRLLEAQLADFQFETRMAESAAAGLELVGECQPDLIVLDLLLPDRNGYDLIKAFKEDPRTKHVPVLVVSAMSDVQDRVKALEVGADDYIVKGFERLEFEARTRRLLRLKLSLDKLNAQCNQALHRAVTDSLTGFYTHGFMRETLDTQLNLAERHGHPYSAIFADIDHFKEVNDRYGHAAGDAVLRGVADTLRGLVRKSDTLIRYGGEEFVALLPHTGGEEALLLAERMRAAIAAMRVGIQDAVPVQVTISLGVASYPDDATDGETLVQRGDAAMYLAKRSGRNRAVACGRAPRASCANARVVIAGAGDNDLRMLEAYLAAEGCQLLTAHDGIEAVDLVRSEQPDLVIMDSATSRLAGFDVCRRIKQDSKTQWLPVLMITRASARDEKLRGIDAGADEFISAPIDKIELITRVRALVRHKRNMDVLEDAETVVFALAQAVEDRDPLLGNHMQRVADYAVQLGRAVGLSERELKALWRAGRVHDIGKIAIPDAILFKPGKLTTEEFAVIRQHPEKAYRLLVPMRTFGDSLPAVRYHHERLDGSGYPLGLRGDEVPRLAQILALADVFDALTGPRHYRDALPKDQAMEVLRDEAHRGLHDPALIETFLTAVAGQSDEPTAVPAAEEALAVDAQPVESVGG